MAEGFFKGRKVLVTGATGFLGSWLVETLAEKGADVACIIRDKVPRSMFFRNGLDKRVASAHSDLTDLRSIERIVNEYEPEIVLHLGAQALVGLASASPTSTFDANIRGTWNVLESCRLHDRTVKSVVVASSDKAYGDQDVLPYSEEMPLRGRNPYDASKSCADILSQCYGKTYGLPVSITRCANFYGGGDLNLSRIVPYTIHCALEGKRPLIRSDGKSVRDYLYVKDAVSAYLTLAQKTEEKGFRGEAFNFSSEEYLSVLDMVGRILSMMGKGDLQPDIRNESRNEIRDQRLCAEKARRILGWKSEWPFEKAMRETIAWYSDDLSKR
ncbi:MAG: GDP-mannose 4,6-dehydratase [Candidatus Micrarchaeota archaeon]